MLPSIAHKKVFTKIATCYTYSVISRISTFLCLLIIFQNISGQIVLNDQVSQEEQVKALEGPGVQFSNIQINCPGREESQMGLFDASRSNLGIANGLVLTNGYISLIKGPNNEKNEGSDLALPGDLDLTNLLVDSLTTKDACIVEFDLITMGDSLNFEYVFGSEEYPNFVFKKPDVFGFFISGPGINGTFSNNSKNIALVPNTNTPVSVSSINNGIENIGPCQNCEYYVANGTGIEEDPEYTLDSVIQYDGFTTPLIAVSEVQTCQNYHIKLAIADALDHILDAAVFIKSNSFVSSPVKFVVQSPIYEGCKNGIIKIIRKDTSYNVPIELFLSFNGTAQHNVDYQLVNETGQPVIPDNQFTLAPNEDTLILRISAVADGIIEQEGESITVNFESLDCHDERVNIKSLELLIYDELNVEVPDTIICLGETAKVEAQIDEEVTYFWNNSQTKGSNTYIESPLTTVFYTVYVEDENGCFGSDTGEIFVIDSSNYYITIEHDSSDYLKVWFNSNATEDSIAESISWVLKDSNNIALTSLQAHEFNYLFLGPGKYEVSAYITPVNSLTCPFNLSKEVIIRGVRIPNIITPNNDGLNDYFTVIGLNNYSLYISNRYGKRVYSSDRYFDDFNGDELADGLYYYSILSKTGLKFKGWFEIIR